jgi:hypothetical protein
MGTAVAQQCRDDPKIVGQCFAVHGRVAFRANMRLYLWPIGTPRLLAISYPPEAQSEPPFMPDNLRRLIDLEHAVFGDFEVCPLSPERPGRLRFVCIQSASHLVLRPW